MYQAPQVTGVILDLHTELQTNVEEFKSDPVERFKINFRVLLNVVQEPHVLSTSTAKSIERVTGTVTGVHKSSVCVRLDRLAIFVMFNTLDKNDNIFIPVSNIDKPNLKEPSRGIVGPLITIKKQVHLPVVPLRPLLIGSILPSGNPVRRISTPKFK